MKKIPNPFLRAFVEVAPPMMNAEMRPDRCLNATRVLIDVMSAFGVRATALSVKALAINDVFFRGIRKFGRWPENNEEGRAIIDAGGYALGVDTVQTPEDDARGGWAGHLVAIVQDFLVDASAGQMHRPQHCIDVPDILVTPVSKRFLKGKGDSVEVDLGKDSRLFYWARNDDRSYESISGFQPHPMNVDITARIANAIADKLGRRHPYALIKPESPLDLMVPHVCEDHDHEHHH